MFVYKYDRCVNIRKGKIFNTGWCFASGSMKTWFYPEKWSVSFFKNYLQVWCKSNKSIWSRYSQYEVCSESIQPFWQFQVGPAVRPWCKFETMNTLLYDYSVLLLKIQIWLSVTFNFSQINFEMLGMKLRRTWSNWWWSPKED